MTELLSRPEARQQAGLPEPIVQLRGVRKTYDGSVAVERVDLEVRAGEFFTMLGPSGSGKTTSLRLIAGFEHPDEGSVIIGGHDATRVPPHRRDVNTVFQDYALFPHMSVADNIGYGLDAKGVRGEERRDRIAAALRMIRLDDLAGRKPQQLSGGQRQRVGLARAIVNRPRVLLLDEPLGALDLKLRQDMQIEIKRLQRDLKITFLYVTHDQEEALTMSDRIAVFNRGRIEQIGTPREIYERPANAFVAGFVGTSSLIERGGHRLVLRPEKVRLLEEGTPVEPGQHVEPGILRELVYQGMFTRLEIALEDGTLIQAIHANTVPFGHQAGDAVRVGWRPADVATLSSTAPMAEEQAA